MIFIDRRGTGQNKMMIQDRLGSVVASGLPGGTWERMSYYPYGEERTTTANNRDKFGTYWRDDNGLDYAWNRYYQSGHGGSCRRIRMKGVPDPPIQRVGIDTAMLSRTR